MQGRIGFRGRLAAFLIDHVVIFTGGGLLSLVLYAAGIDIHALPGAEERFPPQFGVLPLGFALLTVAWFLWEGLTGAALGKRILRMHIKCDDGTAGGPTRLLARAALKFSGELLLILATLTGIGLIAFLGSLVGLVIFIGCFFALGQTRQALHDTLAKTAVYPT